MKKFIYFFLFTSVLIITSCEVVDPVKEEPEEVTTPVEHVAMLYENDLYYFPDFSEVPIKIETPASSEKSHVKIHPTETKFAYLDENGSPVIIDLSGNVEATLTQHTNVKTMDWTADGQTLYILIGNEMFYHGPALSLPPFTFEDGGVPMTEQQVTSASVSPNNDLAYTVRYFDNTITNSFYHEKLIFKLNDGTKIVRPNYDQVSERLTVTNFSKNGDLVVGYSEYHTEPLKLGRIELFEDLTKEPDTRGQGSAKYMTPTYRSDMSYFLVGYEANNSGDETYYPRARSLVDTEKYEIIRDDYTTVNYDLYLDWR